MSYALRYTSTAEKQFNQVARKDPTKHRMIVTCLRQIGEDPKHPALHSHKYSSISGPNGEEVWESYVENNVSAWRVFWCLGPDDAGEAPGDPIIKIITIVAITPHP